ncbi:MAG: WYL domain-containing protein, partial [Clostridia bacterium]|nr:WYL domain-containing protein [Clostridia bacterium]
RAGVPCERKSLYRDLNALSDAGFTVEKIRSKDTRYYWAGNPMTESDLLLFSNLVRISPQIPRKRKPELQKKLRAFVSLPLQKTAFSNLLSVVPESSVTERVYCNVEVLFDAILSGNKVRFSYRGTALREQVSPRRVSPLHTVSPYRLVWSDGYYLVAADEEESLVFYRVDRIEELTKTSFSTVDIREIGGDLDFDLDQYIKGYFTSLEDPVHMVFRISDGFLSEAERKFPFDATVEPAVDGSYLLTCDVSSDEALFGWLLLHSEDVQLLYPESAVCRLREFSRAAARVYVFDDTAESGINYEE